MHGKCVRLCQFLAWVVMMGCEQGGEGPLLTPDPLQPSAAGQPAVPMQTTPVLQPHELVTRAHDDPDEWTQIGRGGYAVTTNAKGEIYLADGTLQKLDAQGKPIWCCTPLDGRAFVLVALEDGGVLVGGEHNTAIAGSATMQGFLTSVDADGKPRWTRLFDEPSSPSRITGLARGDGQLYVAGQFKGTLRVGTAEVSSARTDLDFFVLALSPDALTLRWSDVLGSATDDPDGPVLAAVPEGGVVAAGHMHSAALGFVRSYAADGGLRQQLGVHGQVSLFQVVSDPQGHVWAAGVMRGAVELDGQRPRRLVTGGEFDAFVLQLDASGTLVSLEQVTSPRDGGARSLGLAPHADGVWFLHDYGYHSLGAETREVIARVWSIDGRGMHVELEAFALSASFSRHAAASTAE
ncbi:MAG TPA: hypothetical protein VJR89_28760, partial [Polyangiales bacterium]|nr:hypothetical protein [Polyangiales bacterium]